MTTGQSRLLNLTMGELVAVELKKANFREATELLFLFFLPSLGMNRGGFLLFSELLVLMKIRRGPEDVEFKNS